MYKQLSPDQLLQLADTFKLLGDSTRLAILTSCLEQEKTVSEIVALTGASQSLVSHHLRLLRSARLLKPRRAGRNIYYHAHDDHISCTLKDMIEHIQEDSQ